MARDSLVTLCTSLAGSCYWSSSPLVTGIEDSEREMEGFGTIGIASPPLGICLLTCGFPSFGSLRWSLVLGLYCFIITLLLSLGWGFLTDLQGGWLTRYWAVIWVYEIGWFDHLVCLFWPASLSCEVGCPICFPWICCLVCCLSRDEFVGRNLLYLVSHTPSEARHPQGKRPASAQWILLAYSGRCGGRIEG